MARTHDSGPGVTVDGGMIRCVAIKYTAPATHTNPSAPSFAAVNALLIPVLPRTPRKLIAARIPTSAVRTANFASGCVARGQNSPRYVTNKFALAAHAVSRTNHTSHPT